MTKAKSALLMGKCLGLVYDCSNVVVLNQIMAQSYVCRSL